MFQYHQKAAIKLRYKYYNECNIISEESTPTLSINPKATNVNSTVNETLACIRNAIDKVMIENGLEGEWAQLKFQLILISVALNECINIEVEAEAQK